MVYALSRDAKIASFRLAPAGPGGGQRQQQQHRSETQSPLQLREWLVQRGTSGGSDSCPYVIRTGVHARQTCGKLHTQHRCFSRLDVAWRAEFGDDVELPRWADRLRSRIAIFDLDFDAIPSTIYAMSVSAEGDCYLCVPPDPGIAAAAQSSSESSTLPSTAPAQDLHTFTLDSGASHCFFRDSTTLTPLPAPVPVRLADPSGGSVVARSSTILPCPAVPSGSLSGLHLPLFSTNLVSTAALQDAMVTTTTSGDQPTSLDVWGPAHVSGQGRKGYFMLVVDDYTRYTTVFPLRSKVEVVDVLIPWIRTVRLQLRERFGQDLPVLRLHSDRGGEFSSNLLRDLCRGEGILQSFTLLDSPQQNGIAERRIGLVMEVARTSMIHAAAPHFLWLFAVQYAAHQLNLWPRVSLPETSLTLRWTGEVSDASVFWEVTFDESVPFYRLFPYRSAPPPPPPLFLAPSPPPVDPLPPKGPTPSGVSQVDPLPSATPVQVAVSSSAAPGAASRGAASGGAASGGAASGGAEPGGAGSKGAGSRGAEPAGVEPVGAESEGAESGGAEPRAPPTGGAVDARAGGARVTDGAGGTGGTAAAGPGVARTRERSRVRFPVYAHVGRCRLVGILTGAAGTGGVGGAGAGDPTEPGAAGAGGFCAGGAGAGGAGVGGTGTRGAGAAGAGAVDPGAGGAGGTVRPRPYFVFVLQELASPLPAPSPYTEQPGGLIERREPASRPVSLVRTARRAPRSRPPPDPGTHAMALRPSSNPLLVPLPAPLESSLPEVPDPASDPASDRARAASPTVSRLLATAITDPSFDSAATSALVAELLDFASPPSVMGECALCTDVLEDRQEDFETTVPRFASMLLAPKGDPNAPDIPTPRSYAEAITGTYIDEVPPAGANIVDGMWIFRVKRPPGSPPAFKARYIARGFNQRQGVDYFQTFSPTPKMTTLRVLLHVAAQCDYDLRRPVYCLRQAPREWHDTLRATLAALGFAPSAADRSLFLRTETSLPPFYDLVYIDDLVFATANTEAVTLVKSLLQKRHTCTDLGKLRSYLGLQITRDRARRIITLTQSYMVHHVLQHFSFQFSSPQPTPLSTSHSLSAPPSDESVEPSGLYPELVGCLMYLMTCTRPDLAYPLSLLARYVAPDRHKKVHLDAAKRVLRYLCSTLGMGLLLGGRGPVVLTGHAGASWVDDSATQWSSQGYTFSHGSGSVSWRSSCSSSVLSSSFEAEIYVGAMAA
ncbi:unnamed protein product [Closterium sp. NIES-53]